MDFGDATRTVFFQTEFEEFLYATHGGTLFVVRFRGKPYAITAKHVLGDFRANDIFITQEKHAQKGSLPAPVKTLCFPSSPVAAAAGTDVEDLCVIEFEDGLKDDFFHRTEIVIDDRTIATSEVGDKLMVAGVLKEKTQIESRVISPGYCRLEFQDAGATADPILRRAIARFDKPEFKSITGISGSPVFNVTKNALCGMVVRGSLTCTDCEIHYIDIFDIRHLLENVATGATQSFYFKPRQ